MNDEHERLEEELTIIGVADSLAINRVAIQAFPNDPLLREFVGN